MPKLHRKKDGTYCIRGQLFNGGLCTWQVGEDALRFLQTERGVRDEDSVTIADVKNLVDKKWIRTGGGGIGTANGEQVASAIPPPLIEQVVKWARHGNVADLQNALKFRQEDYWDKCFCSPFLIWLETLDHFICLADLDTLPYSDFIDLAKNRLDRLDNPFWHAVSRESWALVPWQVGRVVGRVSQHLDSASECPVVWRDKFPVLCRLFNLLKSRREHTTKQRPGPTGSRKSESRTPRLRRPPFIRWDVDEQRIVAVLPAQQIAINERLHWEIEDAVAPPVRYRLSDGANLVDENRHADSCGIQRCSNGYCRRVLSLPTGST